MSEAKTEMWAVVELMGHVKMAGRVSEEERFGAKMGRIEIPQSPDPNCICCNGSGQVPERIIERPESSETMPAHACRVCERFVTQWFGGGSIYRITAVSEEAARLVAKAAKVQPINPLDLPRALAAPGDGLDFDDDAEE
jgi:hypothetical protein